jgi:hypothetical protein
MKFVIARRNARSAGRPDSPSVRHPDELLGLSYGKDSGLRNLPATNMNEKSLR